MYELIGTLASVIVLLGFTQKENKTIRAINIIGCILFVIYGLLINAFSIWFLNATLILIHVYHIEKD